MKRLVVCGFVLALCGVGAAVPAQGEDVAGTLSASNGVLYDDCRPYPYAYAVDVPDGAASWDIEASLLGPGGSQADSDFVVSDDPVGTSAFVLCPPTNPYGTYTIRATFEWTDADAVRHQSALPETQFSLRKPRTRTTLAVSTRRPAYRKVVTYRVKASDERPQGYVGTAFTWVHLQKRVHGQWVRIKGSRAMTHSTGVVQVRLRYRLHHKRMWVRAVTVPSARYTGSTSAATRIW